jgi:hypothetical protein
MNESFLVGFVVASVVAAAIILRLAPRDDRRRLSRLEGKLDALLKHQGIRFNPFADVPPGVREALSRGKKIEAIKEYRAATGVGLAEAKEFMEELWSRS